MIRLGLSHSKSPRCLCGSGRNRTRALLVSNLAPFSSASNKLPRCSFKTGLNQMMQLSSLTVGTRLRVTRSRLEEEKLNGRVRDLSVTEVMLCFS